MRPVHLVQTTFFVFICHSNAIRIRSKIIRTHNRFETQRGSSLFNIIFYLQKQNQNLDGKTVHVFNLFSIIFGSTSIERHASILELTQVKINKMFERKIVYAFLPIRLNTVIRCGYSKCFRC